MQQATPSLAPQLNQAAIYTPKQKFKKKYVNSKVNYLADFRHLKCLLSGS
jgi:hypothetical protein